MDDGYIITFQGLETTIGALKKHGWEITIKKRYINWRDMKNSELSNDYLYIRHPIHKLLIRVKYQDILPLKNVADMMISERNTPTSQRRAFYAYTWCEKDLEWLFTVIGSIQAVRKRKRRQLPQADILSFLEQVR